MCSHIDRLDMKSGRISQINNERYYEALYIAFIIRYRKCILHSLFPQLSNFRFCFCPTLLARISWDNRNGWDSAVWLVDSWWFGPINHMVTARSLEMVKVRRPCHKCPAQDKYLWLRLQPHKLCPRLAILGLMKPSNCWCKDAGRKHRQGTLGLRARWIKYTGVHLQN